MTNPQLFMPDLAEDTPGWSTLTRKPALPRAQRRERSGDSPGLISRLSLAPFREHRQGRPAPDGGLGQQAVEVVDAADGPVAERDDQVALADAVAGGRAPGLDPRHQDARPAWQTVGASQPARHRHALAGDADVGPADAPVSHEPGRHERGGVDRRWRSRCPAPGQDHGGVDADDLAAGVDQRAARVAGVERGVGLDHVVDQAAGARAERAAERADDAGGHRALEAERVADGDRELARRAAPAESPRRAAGRVGRVDAQDREVGVRVVADHARRRGGGRRRA